MMPERVVALALLTKGETKIPFEDKVRYSEILGVSTRAIYRYLEKIERAKFLIADFKNN